MHFHLPKPLHGWREFIGEVAIIVLGVLIALGAEQMVEAMHWHHEVVDATATLKSEVADQYDLAAEASVVAPCVNQQLLGLEQALLAQGPYKSVPMFSDQSIEFTYRAPSRDWPDNVWRSTVSEGVSSHLDRDLRIRLARHYLQVAGQQTRAAQADAILWKMRILARPLPSDPTSRVSLASEIEEGRGVYELMGLVGRQMMRDIDQIGWRPPQRDLDDFLKRSGTVKYCRAHRLPIGGLNTQ